MHIQPEKIQTAVNHIAQVSDRAVIFEYFEPVARPLAFHNWLHDYKALFEHAGFTLTDCLAREDEPQNLFYFTKTQEKK